MGKTYKDQQQWERKQSRPKCALCGRQIDGRVFYHDLNLPVCEKCNSDLDNEGYGHGV